MRSGSLTFVLPARFGRTLLCHSSRVVAQRTYNCFKMAPVMSTKISYKDLKEFTEQGRHVLSHSAFTSGAIHTSFKSMCLFEQALGTDSQALRSCETLFIESPDSEDLKHGDENKDEWKKKCSALVKVLESLATHQHLRSFAWTWKPGYMDCGQPEIPVEVFTTLVKNAPSLQSLNIDFTCADLGQSWPSWEAFPSDHYTSLRRLRLGLRHAHNGDGAPLRRMLAALPGLQSLNLHLTQCCGLYDFALSSHHPGLLSFSLDTAKLPDKCADDEPLTRNFFKRHPLIQYLNLRYGGRAEGSDFSYDEDMSDIEEHNEIKDNEMESKRNHDTRSVGSADLPIDATECKAPPVVCDGIFEFDKEDLPNLQVLSVDSHSFHIVPSLEVLAERPLEALEISDGSIDAERLHLINPGLKCLHLDFGSFISGSRRSHIQTEVLPAVLKMKNMPNLVELRITYQTSIPYKYDDFTSEEDSDPTSEEHMARIKKELGPEALEHYEEFLASKAQAEHMLESDDAEQFGEDEYENQASPQKTYSGDELIELLRSLPPESLPSLTALTIEDTKIDPLDPNLLNNLPCKLPSLRYLGWNTRGFDNVHKTLYELVRHEDGRISAREVEPLWTPPNRDGRELWIDDNVYDQFGEASHDW